MLSIIAVISVGFVLLRIGNNDEVIYLMNKSRRERPHHYVLKRRIGAPESTRVLFRCFFFPGHSHDYNMTLSASSDPYMHLKVVLRAL